MKNTLKYFVYNKFAAYRISKSHAKRGNEIQCSTELKRNCCMWNFNEGFSNGITISLRNSTPTRKCRSSIVVRETPELQLNAGIGDTTAELRTSTVESSKPKKFENLGTIDGFGNNSKIYGIFRRFSFVSWVFWRWPRLS